MISNLPKRDRANVARRRLARGICVKLQLPQSDALAHIIGNGTESTSEAAVNTWLDEYGLDPSRFSLQEACDALQSDLMARLDA